MARGDDKGQGKVDRLGLRTPGGGVLSARTEHLRRATYVIAAATVLAVVGLAIAYLAGGFTGTEEVPPTDTTPSASPTTVRTYDVDADGSADYAVIEDEVVSARDSDGDDSSLDTWLSFTGIVLAALLGAGATVMAGWLNRDVANAVNDVNARIERLEGGA